MYGSRLKSIARKCYNNLNPDHIDGLLSEIFMSGLKSYLAKELFAKEYVNFNDCVKFCEKLEIRQKYIQNLNNTDTQNNDKKYNYKFGTNNNFQNRNFNFRPRVAFRKPYNGFSNQYSRFNNFYRPNNYRPYFQNNVESYNNQLNNNFRNN